MVSFLFIMEKKVWVALAVELLRDHLRKSDLLVKVTELTRMWQFGMDSSMSKAGSGCPLGRGCAPQIYISVRSLQACFALWTKALLVCVCVYLCGFFFPPVYSAHGAVPKDCAHRISSADCWSGTYLWTGDLVFKLSRAEEPFPTLSGLLWGAGLGLVVGFFIFRVSF